MEDKEEDTKPVNYRFPVSLIQRLEKAHKETMIPKAALVRKALDEFLKKLGF